MLSGSEIFCSGCAPATSAVDQRVCRRDSHGRTRKLWSIHWQTLPGCGGREFYVSMGAYSTQVTNSITHRAFISPILHPADPNTLPSAVKFISPITGPAHPSISSLAWALLHPSSPSCGTAFVHHILLSVPPLARFLTTVTLALSVLKFKTILSHPISAVNSLSKKIIKLTAILSAAAGSAWGTLCLWHVILPRSVLPTKRFFLSGAVAGIPFAFLENSRSIFMYFFRLAVRSKWDVGVKNGLWKGWKGGDLWIIVLAWAVMGSLLEHRPSPVQGKGVRKSLAWLRGDGFVDPVEAAAKKKARKSSTQKQPGNEARA